MCTFGQTILIAIRSVRRFRKATCIPKPSRYPEELLAHAEPSGVDRIVLIQMSYYQFDNSYMLDVMEGYPGVFSGIAIVDWEAERPDETMLQLAEQGVRGFRIYPTDAPIESWLDGPGFERMFVAGAAHNLAICPLINPDAFARSQ